MTDSIDFTWRGPIADEESVDLVVSHGGRPSVGWWPQIGEHSLGWVGARDHYGPLSTKDPSERDLARPSPLRGPLGTA